MRRMRTATAFVPGYTLAYTPDLISCAPPLLQHCLEGCYQVGCQLAVLCRGRTDERQHCAWRLIGAIERPLVRRRCSPVRVKSCLHLRCKIDYINAGLGFARWAFQGGRTLHKGVMAVGSASGGIITMLIAVGTSKEVADGSVR